MLKQIEVPQVTKRRSSPYIMVVNKQLQISKGITTFKNLLIVDIINEKTQDKYHYLLQCNQVPPVRVFHCGLPTYKTEGYQFEAISEALSAEFTDSLNNWSKEDHKPHLSPYSYLYCFMKTKYNVNLHDLWSFTLEED